MRISRIRVRNFRSLKSVEVDVTRFSIFVGQNNHGKTNLFEAIEWFYAAKSSPQDYYFNRKTTDPIVVELAFDDVLESDIEKLTTDASKTKIRAMLGESRTFSIVKSSEDHKRKYLVGEEDK